MSELGTRFFFLHSIRALRSRQFKVSKNRRVFAIAESPSVELVKLLLTGRHPSAENFALQGRNHDGTAAAE